MIVVGLSTTAFAEGKWTRWFSSDCQYPGGSRQVCKHGKLWPPYPRPVGPKEPFMHKYHRTHYWPYPYVCDDRSVVRQVCDQQSQNGWMAYTTLYDYHFDPATQELNQSGRLKLEWIAQQTPQRYRVAYVAASLNPQDSDIRLANVKAILAGICGSEDAMPPVCLRIAQSVGTPAEEVYLIRGAYLQSTPAPRLPYVFDAGDSENAP